MEINLNTPAMWRWQLMIEKMFSTTWYMLWLPLSAQTDKLEHLALYMSTTCKCVAIIVDISIIQKLTLYIIVLIPWSKWKKITSLHQYSVCLNDDNAPNETTLKTTLKCCIKHLKHLRVCFNVVSINLIISQSMKYYNSLWIYIYKKVATSSNFSKIFTPWQHRWKCGIKEQHLQIVVKFMQNTMIFSIFLSQYRIISQQLSTLRGQVKNNT